MKNFKNFGHARSSYTLEELIQNDTPSSSIGSVSSTGLILAQSSEESSGSTSETVSRIIDPLCDPEAPRAIYFEDVTSAAFKIRSAIVRTPCTKSFIGDHDLDLYGKKDYLQYTGR